VGIVQPTVFSAFGSDADADPAAGADAASSSEIGVSKNPDAAPRPISTSDAGPVNITERNRESIPERLPGLVSDILLDFNSDNDSESQDTDESENNCPVAFSDIL